MTTGPWPFVLLALAAYRVWKLIGDDEILARPRDAAVRRLGDKWELFLVCPWCAGFWVTLAWWGAWWAWPRTTLIVAAPFALNAVVGTWATVVERAARA